MLKNTATVSILALSALSLSAHTASPALAGPLDPPAGPVAPTQATVIDTLPFTITEPGSYVLTGNLDVDFTVTNIGAITVNTSDVTIDFQGFLLVDSTINNPVGDGVRIQNGAENVVVRNGSVRGFSRGGIFGLGSTEVRVENMRTFENGGPGILLRDQGTVVSCTANGNGDSGIQVGPGSVVLGCRADNNGAEGVQGNRFDDLSSDGFLIKDCIATNNATAGITLQLQDGGRTGIIESCVTTGNGAEGILVTNSLIRGCFSRGNTGADISAGGTSAVIDSLP